MPDPSESHPEASSSAQARSAPSIRRMSFFHGPSHARLWIVAAVGLVIDLYSKHWAFTELEGLRIVVPHLLHFRRSLNPGALFGMGHGLTPVFIGASMLALAFVIYLFANTPRSRISMHLALGMILAGALGNLYDRTFVRADAVWYPAGVGWRSWFGTEVYLTGKLTNETDDYWFFREWPEGRGKTIPIKKQKGWSVSPVPVVRDFIKIDTSWMPNRIQLWKWIFNVADALLVVGVGVLLINFWWDRGDEYEASDEDEASKTDPEATA